MPCVATLGAIAKEHGTYWAGFSMLWSFSIAYTLSVILFQAVNWSQHPTSSLIWIVGLSVWQVVLTLLLFRSGKKKALSDNLIPMKNIS
jgi:ferrous iron transport protein B